MSEPLRGGLCFAPSKSTPSSSEIVISYKGINCLWRSFQAILVCGNKYFGKRIRELVDEKPESKTEIACVVPLSLEMQKT